MKQASTAAMAILAAGAIKRIDLYQFTIAGSSQSYYFTSHQTPVPFAGQTYQSGLVIKRGPVKFVAGLSSNQMTLTCSPDQSSSAGPVTVGGFPFLSAVAQRTFDRAHVLFSKMFLQDFKDTSPGATPWLEGEVGPCKADDLTATFTINDMISRLNVQMPPRIIQASCGYTLFGKGCGLNAADFAETGTVVSNFANTVLSFSTSLSRPNGWFTRGKITFINGRNATNPRTTYFVKMDGGGAITLVRPLSNLPTAGDSFIITPGCDKKMATCANKDTTVGPAYNNLGRFPGTPFVPVPESLLDGGTSQPVQPMPASQGGSSIGSTFGSGVGQRGTYKA